MGSVVINSGKFAVYRNNLSDGSSPYVNILAADDGAGCVIQDKTGKVWVFRIYNAKVQYKRSKDTTGLDWDDWVDIVASLVKDGVPTAEELPTGRITVAYWKTDSKWYCSFSNNYGTSWTEEEITT